MLYEQNKVVKLQKAYDLGSVHLKRIIIRRN